jgi:hypothetical protein
MSAEDDILFLAPASITNSRPGDKISITMCDVSRGGGTL